MSQITPNHPVPDEDDPTLPAMADDFLQRTVHPPDLTRSIMGRLGYMQVSSVVARRARRRLWFNRTCFCLGMIGLMLCTMWIFQQTDLSRQPREMTLPDALEHDYQFQQQRLNQMIRSIRIISPGSNQPTQMKNQTPRPPATIEDDIDHSAVAPVRWV